MSSLININALLNLFEKLTSQYLRKLYQILPLKKGKNKKIKKLNKLDIKFIKAYLPIIIHYVEVVDIQYFPLFSLHMRLQLCFNVNKNILQIFKRYCIILLNFFFWVYYITLLCTYRCETLSFKIKS